MPPARIKRSKHKTATPNDSQVSSSTSDLKAKLHRTVKLESQGEVLTTPGRQSSVLCPTSPPPVHISKPKSKPYYAIKSEHQESKPPTQKAPIPYLTAAARQELWAIWKSDPRIPTVASRYAWATSRNVDVTRVHSWFCVRKLEAKKAGKLISNEKYDLSLEPCTSQVVGKELVPPSAPPSPACHSDTTGVDLSSDDALVSFGADCFRGQSQFHIPHRYSPTPALSVVCSPTITPAPTISSTPSVTPEPTEAHAYMRHYAQESPTLTPASCSKYAHSLVQTPQKDRIDSTYCQDLFRKVCSQGDPKLSDFTCALCEPVKDYSQIDQLLQQSIFPLGISSTVFPTRCRLNPTPDALMELSAIPYLLCMPPLAVHTTPYTSATWIEEELTKVLIENHLVSGVRTSDPSLRDLLHPV